MKLTIEKCMPELEELEREVAIEEVDVDLDRVRELAEKTKQAFLKSDGRNEVDYSLLDLAAVTGNLTYLQLFIDDLNEK